MNDSVISGILVDANFLMFFHSGVYMGSSPKTLPQKENRLAAEN
jgi:hypothetical protein